MKRLSDTRFLNILGTGWTILAGLVVFWGGSTSTIYSILGVATTCFVGATILEAVVKAAKPRCPRAHLENHNAPSCILCLGWDMPKGV